MKQSFIHDDFLLTNNVAQKLYHEYAATQPIFDYHCHLIPAQIAEDKHFKNITELWLGGDHYKWRLLRLSGIDEQFITGGASDKDKFIQYASILPNAIGNPVHHWSHLELKRYFNVDQIINKENAITIWEECNKVIASSQFSARELMKLSNVKVVCTGDDPIDDLHYHKLIAKDDDFSIKVLPTFRPDRIININLNGFVEYINKLSNCCNLRLNNISDLYKAIDLRIDYFHNNGCRMSDHGIDIMCFALTTEDNLSTIFYKAMNNEILTDLEVEQYKTAILIHLAKCYAQYQWKMQIHIGALRSVNERMLQKHGRDCGYDTSDDLPFMSKLGAFLSYLDKDNILPHIILFGLSPNVDLPLATMAGCFPGDAEKSKIQIGPAWWLNDHKVGIINQLVAYANASLLGDFIGMTTDSRSFLSYPRHEYFRRILCNLLGRWIEDGEYPTDIKAAGKIIENICYRNAEQFFNF